MINYVLIDGILIILILLFNIILFLTKKKKTPPKKNSSSNYAILIPAREEDKVISKTLESIKRQNPDMSNVYIIIESKKDPTYEIVKKYHANSYIRKKPIKQTKGHALDECLKKILKNKHYDLYFILDADNIIEKDFLKKMLQHWKEGYQTSFAYRNIYHSDSWISICTALLFSIQRTVVNRYRNLFHQPPTLSGSGFYIDGKIMEELGGYPFYSLTEDFELMIFLEENNISYKDADDCMYYDEQPFTLKASINQRVRWIKGVLSNSLKRKKTWFVIISSFALFLFILLCLTLYIQLNMTFGIILGNIITYCILSLLTLIAILLDKKLNLTPKQKIKGILYNPIFLLSFILCFIKVLTMKEVKWDKTEHYGIDQ